MSTSNINLLTSAQSEQACIEITATLPEWFGQPQVNEKYAKGVKERVCLGFIEAGNYIGLICLEFPFSSNANIYWMGVKKSFLGKGIGKALLQAAEKLCAEKHCDSLTVETLSPKESDKNYLKTYDFYLKEGFNPLFELHTYGPDHLMIYLRKSISLRIEKKEHPMEISIEKASLEDLSIVQNLARFYVYDMYRYCGSLKGWDTPDSGLYECIDLSSYWKEPGRHPFLIRVNQELAGFILINKVGISSEVDWNMGEFFIVSKYQGKGIGRIAAERVFKQFPGVWNVMQIPENKAAIAFWEKVIGEYTQGNFRKSEEMILDRPPPRPMRVLQFCS